MDSGISSAGNGLHGVAGVSGVGVPKASPPPPATPLSPEEHHRALDELLNDMLLTVENIPDLPTPGGRQAQRYRGSHVVTLDELPPPIHFQSPPPTGPSLPPPPPSTSSSGVVVDHALVWQRSSASSSGPPPPAADVTAGRSAPPPPAAAIPSAAFSSPAQSLNGRNAQQPQPPPGSGGPALDAAEVQRYIDEGATTSSSEAAQEENIPYHARQDSRPFTYGAIPSGAAMLHVHTGLASPSLVRKASFKSTAGSGSPGTAVQSPVASIAKPSPPPPADFGDERPSPTRDFRLSNGSSSTSPRSPEFHDGTVVGSVSSTPGASNSLTWLQRQQQKLRERREGQLRHERRPQEVRLLSELRSLHEHSNTTSTPSSGPVPLHTAYTNNHNHGYHHSHSASHRADGYTSDTTHFADDDDEEDFSTPLHINTSSPTHKLNSAGSAPASPLLPHRTSSKKFYTTMDHRQHVSYVTNDDNVFNQQNALHVSKERPFVAVKRAHEQSRKYGDSQGRGLSPQEILSSHPLGLAINSNEQPNHLHAIGRQISPSPSPDSSGLLTLVDGQRSGSCGVMRDDSFSSWRTASVSDEPGSPSRSGSPRPQTPAFPVHPRTPYVNNSSQQFDIIHSSASTTTTTTGLPPKSPTTQRKDHSPSPVSEPSPAPQQQNVSIISNCSSGTSNTSRTMAYPTTPHSSASLSDVYLQQSPKSPVALNGGTGQSSPTVYYGHSRRSSVHSNNEPPQEVSPAHVKFVRDTSRFWYKPTISREEAINMLREQPPGTFVVRDSNSFPGAFGLALKVATPPPSIQGKIANINDPGSELVRHFLIEPTSRGVRLKGCANEPVFSSLSALVYQHSLMPMALPCRLLLPEVDGSRLPIDSPSSVSTAQLLLAQGAACNVLYLFTLDTESLTGPQAIKKSVVQLFMLRPLPVATVVHFKVSGQGITLTDNKRQLFFRRHYPVNTISYCGLDPDDHRWSQKSEETGMPISSNRVFGFVARKPASKTDNQCHLFAELEPEQPASAIVNFVSKVMMSGGTMKANIV